MQDRLYFASDYMEGALPEILDRMVRVNLQKFTGYGTDVISESARERIRQACAAPEAEIHFLAGGTQANAAVITTMLRPWQGVMAAVTGHVSVHEAGAIEAGGHKVLALPQRDGKLSAAAVEGCIRAWEQDGNREHMVMPGMVYLSQPTEYGTLYSLAELEAISRVCRSHGIPLYADGARLAYGLACPKNDVTLPDLARLCDAFYIGGTKCGALLGEAVVFPRKDTVPHFFTMIKQRGALLAKGFVAGLQFDTLFTGGLYVRAAGSAVALADRLRAALTEKGYTMPIDSPTNQVFVTLTDEQYRELSERVEMGFWKKPDEEHTTVRIATSWATAAEDVDKLISCL